MTVTDNGRGIPVDIHPKTKRPAIETILCTLHAGGKFDHTAYRSSGGLHGVGASVVNALSEVFIATVWRDGYEWTQEFSRGKPKGNLKKGKPTKAHGTSDLFPARPGHLCQDELQLQDHPRCVGEQGVPEQGTQDHHRERARRGEAGHVQVRQRHPGLHQADRLRDHGREPRTVLLRERGRLQDRVRHALDHLPRRPRSTPTQTRSTRPTAAPTSWRSGQGLPRRCAPTPSARTLSPRTSRPSLPRTCTRGSTAS